MPGIIEQRDIGADELAAEILHRAIETRLVEIELGAVADQREAGAAQRFGHQGCIVPGIVERRDILIAGVSDNQRDALVGLAFAGAKHHEKYR